MFSELKFRSRCPEVMLSVVTAGQGRESCSARDVKSYIKTNPCKNYLEGRTLVCRAEPLGWQTQRGKEEVRLQVEKKDCAGIR